MAMSAFEKAFAAARKANKKEFTWNGKRFNTELKETVRPKGRPTSAASASGPKDRPVNKPKTAGVSPSKRMLPNMAAIREGNQKQREARRDARANRDLAKDVRSALKSTAPKGNRDSKSKGAVKSAMAKAAGSNFR